jgi:hypothetical protein
MYSLWYNIICAGPFFRVWGKPAGRKQLAGSEGQTTTKSPFFGLLAVACCEKTRKSNRYFSEIMSPM